MLLGARRTSPPLPRRRMTNVAVKRHMVAVPPAVYCILTSLPVRSTCPVASKRSPACGVRYSGGSRGGVR